MVVGFIIRGFVAGRLRYNLIDFVDSVELK